MAALPLTSHTNGMERCPAACPPIATSGFLAHSRPGGTTLFNPGLRHDVCGFYRCALSGLFIRVRGFVAA
jgi:hypothetical protein